MSLPVATLTEQIEEVRLAATRQLALKHGMAIKELRPKDVVARSAEILNVAMRTLEKLHENADDVRAFLKLDAETRAAAVRAAQKVAQP